MTGNAGRNHGISVEPDVWIPMRDGVRLSADVYRPAGMDGRHTRMVKAVNAVYLDRGRPSHAVLPVVPAGRPC